ARALPALAHRRLRRRGRGERAPRRPDRELARLALARPAARRDLAGADRVALRGPARGGRVDRVDPRGRPGAPRAALRAQHPADRALERRRGAGARPAPARGRGRVARRAHRAGGARRRPHRLRRRGAAPRAGARPRGARLPRPRLPRAVIRAVVFDLDGVLIDSEHVWDEVREALARERGGVWHPGAQRDMMGMSSPEWSRYMHERIGLAEPPEEINRLVVERMRERYAAGPPWLSGALDAVRRTAGRFALGLASSSNRELIDLVLEAGGVAGLFRATVSSEEVAAGKPAPDVYLEAA